MTKLHLEVTVVGSSRHICVSLKTRLSAGVRTIDICIQANENHTALNFLGSIKPNFIIDQVLLNSSET